MSQFILFGNGGNESIAMLSRVATLKQNDSLIFASVNTHSQPAIWNERIQLLQSFCQKLGISYVRLESKKSLAELILAKKEYPTVKYAWCSAFLKGLPYNAYLDEVDPNQEATVVLPHTASHPNANLIKFEQLKESHHFGGRNVWYPLLQLEDGSIAELVNKSSIPWLATRSLECAPCMHAKPAELPLWDEATVSRIEMLEQSLGCGFQFSNGSEGYRDFANSKVCADKLVGCGSPWGCGL